MIVPGGINANLIAAAFPLTQTISADTADLDVAAAALAAGWDGTTPLSVQITIDAGKYLYASSTSAYAFDTGAGVPDGSVIRVVNNGTICGAGGAGGNGGANSLYVSFGYETGQTQTAGGAGGTAVKARCPVIMVNNGEIAGGGGGGGGGGYAADNHYFQHYYAAAGGGGGGGRGYVGGAAGSSHSAGTIAHGGNGVAGSVSAAGTPGAGTPNADTGTAISGAGGAGGGFGAAGATSSAGGGGTMGNQAGIAGGAAGAAVDGNAFVTWEVTGTITGAQI